VGWRGNFIVIEKGTTEIMENQLTIKDLSSELTVFVIHAGENPNYQDCLTALKNQTVRFKLDIIQDYFPMSVAFQEMLNRCGTKYFIQCDDDMILSLNAVETMYNAIVSSSDKTSMCCYKLNDPHVGMNVFGVKVYKCDIFKLYPYNLNHPSCEVEQLDRMKLDGYVYLSYQTVLGFHSPKWTEESIFDRYYRLMEKYKIYKYDWVKSLPKQLLERVKANPTTINIFALLGATSSIFSDEIEDTEKDNRVRHKDFVRLESFCGGRDMTRVLFVGDEYGWAYHFIFKERKKFSKCVVSYIRARDLEVDYKIVKNFDIIYFHSSNLRPNIKLLTKAVKENNSRIKIVGGHAGGDISKYTPIDLAVAISIRDFPKVKNLYGTSIPVLFMPEAVDSSFFEYSPIDKNRFNVGWAGREGVPKRPYLLDKLGYSVIKKSDHGIQFFTEDKTLEFMKEFYRGLDCFVLTSESECMPRVILEAMSCGLPVVSTNVGSLELVLDVGWLIQNILDEEKLIVNFREKLNLLERDVFLRDNVSKRNRKTIEERFCWSKVQPLWDDLFEYLNNNDISGIHQVETKVRNIYSLETVVPEVVLNKLPASRVFREGDAGVFLTNAEDMLGYLVDSKVDFWLLKETCLECVIYHKLKSIPLSIGVKTHEDEMKLINYIKGRFDIQIYVEPNRRTKIHGVQEYSTVKVPLPVVSYLTEYTGKQWGVLEQMEKEYGE